MADDVLKWIFELQDKLTGPAERMAKALQDVNEKLDKIERGMKSTEDAVRDSESSWGRLFSTFDHGLGIVSKLGGMVVSVAEKVGGMGLAFFEAGTDAASFKESTQVALSTVLGSDEAANRVLNNVVGIAAKLPITTQAAMGYASSALLSGFKEGELPAILKAVGDIGALSPDRPDLARDVFSRYINEIKQQGLSGRHLMFLARETRLPEQEILNQLGKTLHQSPEFIKKHLQNIDHDDALNAIFQVLANKEGGQIGGLSGRLSQTLGGLMTTLRSRKLEFLMDLDTGPAYKAVRGLVKNLTDALDPSGVFGGGIKERVANIFNEMFEPIFGKFSGPDGLGQIEKVLSNILDAGETVGNGLTSMVKGFMESLGITEKLNINVHSLDESFGDLGHAAGEFVKYMTSGGIKDALSALKGAAEVLGVLGKVYHFATVSVPKTLSTSYSFFTLPDAQFKQFMEDESGYTTQARKTEVDRMKFVADEMDKLNKAPVHINQHFDLRGELGSHHQELANRFKKVTAEWLEEMSIQQGAH